MKQHFISTIYICVLMKPISGGGLCKCAEFVLYESPILAVTVYTCIECSAVRIKADSHISYSYLEATAGDCC